MAAEKTLGTKLNNNTDVVEVGGLTSIGELTVESEEIDTTSLDSTGGYREFITSLKDAGEIPIEGIIKSDAQHLQMLGWTEDQASKEWQITYPTSGANWIFTAYLKSYGEGESTIEGARTFSGSLRITGAPVFDVDISV